MYKRQLCGGVLNRKNLAVFGYSALEMLSKINIDVAFISASGYSEECGFTCGFEEQVKLRRLLIEKARSVIILMDSTKFGRMLPYTFAKMEDVNYLVTDQTPSQEMLELAQDVYKRQVLYCTQRNKFSVGEEVEIIRPFATLEDLSLIHI